MPERPKGHRAPHGVLLEDVPILEPPWPNRHRNQTPRGHKNEISGMYPRLKCVITVEIDRFENF